METNTSAAARGEVAVIGGGIAGAGAAYRLARAGARVTLIDRSDEGQATAAGAGIIAPGTSLGDNPLYFRLATPAVRYYPELVAQLAEDGETATGYETCGALFVATSDEETNLLPNVFRTYQERQARGVPNLGEVRRLTGREAQGFFPPLAEHPAALYVPEAARVDGRLMRDALRRAAAKRGVRIVAGNALPEAVGGRVAGVRIAGEGEPERLAVDAVVLAAGAWSHQLGDRLGVPLPTAPQRGQILHLDVPDAETGAWPIVLGFHDQYLLTFRPRRVVAGASRESGSGFDYRLTAGGTHYVLSQALRVAPGLASATVAEWRIGMRPATPDGLPILGPAPGLTNVFVATGFGASGLQLGPWSGAVAADLAMGGSAPVDLGPFGAGRYG
jgi:D-amino-acid dehydrogenase